MFDISKVIQTLQIRIVLFAISIAQSTIVKYIIHKYKYFTNTLYIGDYTQQEFNDTWKVVCMKKCHNNSEYYYVVDSFTPLNKIDYDVVYTLQDTYGNITYFPVFAEEINNMKERDEYNGKNITIYNILHWRINNQIIDLNIDEDNIEKFNKLFDPDDMHFICYMNDNNYMHILNHMYKVKAIF